MKEKDLLIMDMFLERITKYESAQIGENMLHTFAWKNFIREIYRLFVFEFVHLCLELSKMKTLTGYTPIAFAKLVVNMTMIIKLAT